VFTGIVLVKDASGGAVVTALEYANARAYDHAAQYVGGAAAPVWFAPAIAPLVAGIAGINAQLGAINARLFNANASRVTDPLLPLPNAAGAMPVGLVAPVAFPATRAAMGTLTVAQCTTLLGFYGIAIPPGALVANLRNLLRTHCNVPQPDFL